MIPDETAQLPVEESQCGSTKKMRSQCRLYVARKSQFHMG